MQIENDATQALSWADVDRIFQAETGSKDRQEVIRLLISQAARGTRRKTASAMLPDDQADYEEALRRAVARTRQAQTQLTQEKRDAERLWHLLESHAPSRRGMLIRNDRRFQTWGLYECLRERSQSLLEREPGAAIQAAELALAVARGLSTAQYGEESVYDFQGTALVALAQARRVAGDLDGAATSLGQAGLMLSMGSGDLLEKAELESARAALLRDLGRTEEAEEAGRRALRFAHRVGGPKRDVQRSLDETPRLRRRRA
jgi:tetratricopeptide (TPR) repeat protein